MSVPTDRRYTQTHEWCKQDGDEVIVGITQFAADQLTDITFVGLPEVGAEVKAGDPFGELESVKSASDIYAPVSGGVMAINEKLTEEPGLVNRDPFGDAWIIRVRPINPYERNDLLEPAEYEARLAAE